MSLNIRLKIFLLSFFMAAAIPSFGREAYPPFWFCGMQDPQLQLMIHEVGIGQSDMWSVDQTGVHIDSVYHPDNQAYVLLYLHIAPDVQPGDILFHYRQKGKRKELNYTLEPQPHWKGHMLNERDRMYLLMPDRFANGNPENDRIKGMNEKRNSRDSAFGRHGGDLAGITGQLDYLKGLGVSALWLNPVYENNEALESYHGYAITNHYKVDPRLGGEEDYIRLKVECELRGIKLIKDMVFNHIGDQHTLYRDLIDSSWFHFHPAFTRSNFRAPLLVDPYASPTERNQFANGWFDHHMPDLNTENPHVAAFLTQQSIWWVAHFRIDALRIDTYAYPGLTFAGKWYHAVKTQFPDLFVFGELWDHGTGIQAFFGEKQNPQSGLPSLTDFQLCWSIQKAFNEPYGWSEGLSTVYYTLAQDYLYADARQLVTFLDNHDLPRAFGVFGKDTLKMHSALNMLFMMRGIPCLYYGTEQLFSATGNDDEKRQEWRGGWPGDQAPEKYEDSATVYLIRTWSDLRQLHPAFSDEARIIQFIPKDGKYVIMRKNGEHGIALLVSTAEKKTELRLSDYPELFEATANKPMQLSLQKVELNRYAVFYMEQNESVVIEW